MVDLVQLASDTGGLVAFLAFPPLAFGALFLLAFDRPLQGADFGFGKGTFFLLLLGVLIGWIANIPIFLWNGSIMAINVGGALLPIAVSLSVLTLALLPGRWRETLALILGLVASIGGLLFLGVVEPAHLGSQLFLVLAFLALFVAGALVMLGARRWLVPSPLPRPLEVLGAFGLVAVGTWITYLGTQVVPGVGIESAFPDYLIVPLCLGAASVALRWPRRDGPALAYATTTLGVLLGADVVHQPQIYVTPAFLGAIGGAGPLDLVFLSGPFALGVALLVELLARQVLPSPAPRPASHPVSSARGPPRPEGRFTQALSDYAQGRYDPVPREVVEAVDAEVLFARGALGLPASGPQGWLDGLSTHPLLRGDLENLRAMVAEGKMDRDDARRALVTGFLFQRGLLETLSRRFAGVSDRVKAFGLDLILCFLPALPLLYLTLVAAHITSLTDSADSIAYNGAIAALGAWPFVLFVLTEARWGATPGKLLFDLEVVGPTGDPPTFLSVLVRNLPKLLPLEALSVGIGLAVPIALYLSPSDGLPLALLFALAGVALVLFIGVFSVWLIRTNPRHQRLGDLAAGTMVWKGPPFTPWHRGAAGPGTAASRGPPGLPGLPPGGA